ncbi:hypothetical protein HYU13_02895 [Candidatus Woesearchaeota archaeon]|nr:hypothetical protein [Candidatus Woesearchaeota archaeon]
MTAKKDYEPNIPLGFPKPFLAMVDEILEKNPDFKSRTTVIRYAVRKYYEELRAMKKV